MGLERSAEERGFSAFRLRAWKKAAAWWARSGFL